MNVNGFAGAVLTALVGCFVIVVGNAFAAQVIVLSLDGARDGPGYAGWVGALPGDRRWGAGKGAGGPRNSIRGCRCARESAGGSRNSIRDCRCGCAGGSQSGCAGVHWCSPRLRDDLDTIDHWVIGTTLAKGNHNLTAAVGSSVERFADGMLEARCGVDIEGAQNIRTVDSDVELARTSRLERELSEVQ